MDPQKEAERREAFQQYQAATEAYRTGSLSALREALNSPTDFPNCRQPVGLGLGNYPLEYAIYWSPLSFIKELIEAGATPNYPDAAGFPSLIAALGSNRSDRDDVLRLLIESGADINQRGVNDWTPLHYAVIRKDLRAIEILIAHGANAALRTRIDDGTNPLEVAMQIGFDEGARTIREAIMRFENSEAK